MNNQLPTISYRLTMIQTQINNHEERTMNSILQNEPNLQNLHASRHRKNTQKAQILHPLLQIFTRLRRQKLIKIRAFCKYLTLAHLTPCTTKTYIKFYLTKAVSPQNTLHTSRAPRYKKMKNKPNFQPTTYAIREYAKQTQSTFNRRDTRDKRQEMKNGKMQNEPNSILTTYSPPPGASSTSHGRRVTNHTKQTQFPFEYRASRIMQNEPNLMIKTEPKAKFNRLNTIDYEYAKRTQFQQPSDERRETKYAKRTQVNNLCI